MRWCALMVVVCASACTSGSRSGPAIDELVAAIGSAECSNAVLCGSEPDDATCLASIGSATDETLTLVADVDLGTVDYNAELAQQCLDELGAGCSGSAALALAQHASPCNTFAQGTAAMGAACMFSFECADNAACTPGDPECDPSTTCCAGTCGAPVTYAGSGQACAATLPCGDGLYCANSTTKLCQPIVETQGAACDPTQLSCAWPLSCNAGSGATTGTCQPAALSNATCNPMLTVPCDDSRDYCDLISLTCIRRAAVGAACGDQPGEATCMTDATCDGTTCVLDPAAGDDCNQDVGPACLGALVCDDTSTCVLPQPLPIDCPVTSAD